MCFPQAPIIAIHAKKKYSQNIPSKHKLKWTIVIKQALSSLADMF